MDRILLQGMRFWGHHGLLPHEREQGQPFEVDLEVELDLSRARESDRLEETVDYRLLFRAVQEVVEGEPVHLLEHLAERIRRQVERSLEALPVQRGRIRVRVRKPQAPLGGMLDGVQVEVEG